MDNRLTAVESFLVVCRQDQQKYPVPLGGTNIDRNFRRSQHVLPLESKSYNSNQNPTVTSNSKNLSLPRAVPNTVSACFAGRRSTPTSTTVQTFARFFDLPFIMYMLLWLLHPSSSDRPKDKIGHPLLFLLTTNENATTTTCRICISLFCVVTITCQLLFAVH